MVSNHSHHCPLWRVTSVDVGFFPLSIYRKFNIEYTRYIEYFPRARWKPKNSTWYTHGGRNIYTIDWQFNRVTFQPVFVWSPELVCSPNNFRLRSPAPIISGFTTKYDRRYRWLGQLVNAHHNSRFVIGHDWPSQNDTEPLWVAWLADIKVSVADALT